MPTPFVPAVRDVGPGERGKQAPNQPGEITRQIQTHLPHARAWARRPGPAPREAYVSRRYGCARVRLLTELGEETGSVSLQREIETSRNREKKPSFRIMMGYK